VTALAVGLTAGMSLEQWRVFNATGTTHLVAISGLHVTLFAWLSFGVARFLWRVLPFRHLLARESFALVSGLSAAGGYALLAGWSVPTQRTWLMLALYVAGRLLARQVGAGRLWSLALILVLLTDVRAPLAAGFWLSFVAVGVLLAFLAANPPGDSWWRQGRTLLTAQAVIMLALLPLGLAVFGSVSIVGWAVNLVAIPVVSFVFVPVVLLGAMLAWLAPGWSPACFALAAWFYELLWPAMTWCADLPAALWRVTPTAGWFLLALPASFVWLCRWPWAMRLTALGASLPLLFPLSSAPAHGTVRISVLDAGGGTAVLLRTRSRILAYDTGDTWSTRGSRVRSLVLPALDAAGLRALDTLVLPTLDDDRAAAAAWLALERGVGEVQVGRGWPGSGLPDLPCAEARWQWDGVWFQRRTRGGHCRLQLWTGDHTILIGGVQGTSTQWIEIRTTKPITPGLVRSAPAEQSLVIAIGGIAGSSTRARAIARHREQGSTMLDTHTDGGIELLAGPRGAMVLATARSSRHPFHWRRP
jgi:competence protein ComEC